MILNDITQVEKIIKNFPDIYLMDYSVPCLKSWALKYKSYTVISFWYNTKTNTLKFKPNNDFNNSVGYIKDYTDIELYRYLNLKYKKIQIQIAIEKIEKDF